jgi:23S rRNA (cytidine1920-2'-O)/16S rRNA (cytidine1409-2'-O)-methyltransferase
MSKKRLDALLFDRGYFESRERAHAAVMEGRVYVSGRREQKPGTQVAEVCVLEVRGDGLPFVSRGGLKLDKALAFFGISVEGKVCADIGASTGDLPTAFCKTAQ